MRYLFCLLLIWFASNAKAQEFQNCWTYRDLAAAKFFRFNYENDFVFGTDHYFTQGVHFELASPGIAKLPTHYLLLRPENAVTCFGIALESAGYTPATTYSDSILHGDRPFAGMAYLKAFSITANTARKERYSSTLTVGMMGPATGGYEIQSAIHSRTGNADPVGWKYQIGNALILNYELNYERLFFSRRRFLLSVTGTARAGTYSIKAALGGVLMAGWFENPFLNTTRQMKRQAYLFVHPRFDFVGYDASMQGGLFTDNSPYIISNSEMNRIVFRFDGGLRFVHHDVTMSLYARYLTREFDTGFDHANGGLELAFKL